MDVNVGMTDNVTVDVCKNDDVNVDVGGMARMNGDENVCVC